MYQYLRPKSAHLGTEIKMSAMINLISSFQQHAKIFATMLTLFPQSKIIFKHITKYSQTCSASKKIKYLKFIKKVKYHKG